MLGFSAGIILYYIVLYFNYNASGGEKIFKCQKISGVLIPSARQRPPDEKNLRKISRQFDLSKDV